MLQLKAYEIFLDYYKTVGEGNFWSNNCIEYKSKGDT